MAEDETVTREKLIEARDRLRGQIDILEHPIRSRNPQLIAKLRAMLADVNRALDEMSSG